MRTTISLHSNQLTFNFHSLPEELKGLMESHIEESLPDFLAGFLSAAHDKLLWSSGRVQHMSRLKSLSSGEISNAYRKACRNKLPRELGCSVSFQRTLRLPDDGKTYPLPAGLGLFPLRSVASCAERAPASWLDKGGVMLPMYQGEALWISFHSAMPCALKIVSGSVNALTGEIDLHELDSEPQNYLVLPDQPWLDGFKVSKGTVRQFVATPVGNGFSVSEQLAQNADAGGVAIEAFPMKAGRYFDEILKDRLGDVLTDVLTTLLGADWNPSDIVLCCRAAAPCCEENMGLGAGGKIQQEVYADQYGIDAWSFGDASRLCVHTCNALMWRAVTGENPPHPPLTAKEYTRYRIPWFDFYRDDLTALAGTKELAGVKSIGEVAEEKGLSGALDDHIAPSLIIQYGNTRRPEEIQAWGHERTTTHQRNRTP